MTWLLAWLVAAGTGLFVSGALAIPSLFGVQVASSSVVTLAIISGEITLFVGARWVIGQKVRAELRRPESVHASIPEWFALSAEWLGGARPVWLLPFTIAAGGAVLLGSPLLLMPASLGGVWGSALLLVIALAAAVLFPDGIGSTPDET